MLPIEMRTAPEILTEALRERKLANSSYSLRAFARDLKISPQQLSNVLSGRRGLSVPVAERIAAKLGLSVHEAEIFVESFRAKFSISPAQRVVAKAGSGICNMIS
jgi:plasmid maintenance system antidote protein VapI